MIREELARRLKLFRDKSGLTIYDVGDRIGKSGKTVSAWENGRGQPDADMLLTLCDLYGVKSISELYGEESTNSLILSPDELFLVNNYRDLNAEGREKVSTYIMDLKSSGLYIKNNPYGLVEEA